MNVRPIRNDGDYRAALAEVARLMDAAPNTAAGERLDVMTTLIEAYERSHFPMDLPDPVESIRFWMDQRGLAVRDLVPMIGRPNRVYEVLSRKRPLTLAMIRRLNEELGIPAESLIRPSVTSRD